LTQFQGIDWVGDWLVASVDSCDSTMTAIDDLVRQSPEHPIFLYTFGQKSGRGQMGRSWTEEPGKSLALTLAYPQGALPKNTDWVALNKQLSASALMALQRVCPEPLLLKWPNDVFRGTRKLAGILQELRSDHLMFGLGVNLYERAWPEGVNGAALWKSEAGLVGELLDCLQHHMALSQVLAMPVDGFNKALMFLGETVQIQWATGAIQEAVFCGVDERGSAILEVENQRRAYAHGQVRLLTPKG
jgi:biotin-[acetyl-CoA-carboxylase] ligase BirA-like protein